MELKTARLTFLIDPKTKEALEVACREADMTPSQVVRRLIREFMESHGSTPKSRGKAPAPRKKSR